MVSTVDTSESRALVRRATWTGFVARSNAEAEAYERRIESTLSPLERVEAIWELVLRMSWGNDAAEYRLDRSVDRVERR
jgi:hypothetical protein